jgi:flavin-dependent dehydrogenase
MKIAVCGAGLVGSYLYRLLNLAGLGTVKIFEKPTRSDTTCGIKPCAWGTSAGFEELMEYASLDPAKYTLLTCDEIVTNGVKVKAKAMVIDKPKFIADLMQGVKIITTPVPVADFDVIVDSTGYDRSFLPPIADDVTAYCVQYRVISRDTLDFSIDISNLGYAWCFPMSGDEYHIGAGSISMSPQKMLNKLGWLKNSSGVCACTGKIRLSAPYFSLPFVHLSSEGKCSVWGVGESVGCVAPLAGEGIVPGMKSARILVENWGNPEAYQAAILKEFSWMKDERMVLNKAVQGKRLGLLDARVLMNSTKRLKMNLTYDQSLALLKSINRID